jgi:hypothetical protein
MDKISCILLLFVLCSMLSSCGPSDTEKLVFLALVLFGIIVILALIIILVRTIINRKK